MAVTTRQDRGEANDQPTNERWRPSAAGPVEPDTPLNLPPALTKPRIVQTISFGMRPLEFNLGMARGRDVWQVTFSGRQESIVMTSHPDHVKSMFTADPADAPSLTGESPLRPILGPNSVLTLVGERHLRERKMLLPPFHGKAVERYVEMIERVAAREIDRWPLGRPFALAPRMQAVTLDVIMSGVFGIEGTPEPGSPGHRMRETFRRLLRISTTLPWQLVELQNIGREEARGVMRWVLALADRQLYAAIRSRREAGDTAGRPDILSLLLEARDEHGEPLTDAWIRDELMSLVLAGHETTANSLAWTFERLLRNPEPYDKLRSLTRTAPADEADAYVEATVHEGMRVRPVIPIIVRMLKKRWRLGEYVVPAETPAAMSIVALHHREDVYPEPRRFDPDRFVAVKPGTYTWIPFGGGIRRCLGASLAMAEQRLVLRAIAERTDLVAPSPKPERARQRNVTMIPSKGCRVIVQHKR
jgi:cytochrome P450